MDASVVAPALADDGRDGDRARTRLAGERLVAPELLDLEVLSMVRRARSYGDLDDRRAAFAVDDLASLAIVRVSHAPLIERIWELRDNVTVYDAAYVALAEALDIALITADAALAHAPGPRCAFEVLG